MTQLEYARSGKISPQMRQVSTDEALDTQTLKKRICDGTIVIPKNSKRSFPKVCGIGQGLRTKINANIGTSKDSSSVSAELKKMELAVELGGDTIMDLSTGSDIAGTRRRILAVSTVPVGTVPIYEMAIDALKGRGSIRDMRIEDIFAVLERQAHDGVDFFTIHAGVVRKAVEILREHPRVIDIVSRGGAFIAEWMLSNKSENPFYAYFDRVLDIAREYDVTISLGDGLRPGAIADATDQAQILELIALGELQKKALRKGVQVMIEGPGHIPMNQIAANVALEKSICNGAPFYVLGPLVTDVAPGYDHITAAIGGAIAASHGADFLCYVTPSEHLRLPTLEDVRDGVIASRIAAHAADIAKGVKNAADWDMDISKARRNRDWKRQFKLAMDRSKPMKYRKSSKPETRDVCTMCGEFCSIKISEKCLERKR